MRQSPVEKFRSGLRSRAAPRPTIEINGIEEYAALIVSPSRKLNPTQRDFILAPDRIGLYMGPVGCAKSASLIGSVLVPATLYPGSCWGIFRSTWWTMNAPGGIIQDFMEACERLGPNIILDKKGIGSTHGPAEVWLATTDLETGKPGEPTKVIIHSLDDLEKLGSTKFNGIAVEEASEITEHMAAKLNERLRWQRPGQQGTNQFGPFFLRMACNPVRRSHWIHRKFCGESDCDPVPWGRKFRPHKDENRINLPPDYYEEISKGYTPEMRVRFIEGECGPDPAGLPVFPEFRPSLHVADLRQIPGQPLIRGWDFGRRRPALVWSQVTSNGCINRLACELGNQESLERFCQRILLRSSLQFPGATHWHDFCDPHGVQKRDTSDLSSIDVLRQFGLAPRFKDVGIDTGLDQMSKGLSLLVDGRPRSMFDRVNCAMLIEGYSGGYTYQTPRAGHKLKEKPLADGYYEHLMDADRYIEVNLGLGSQIPPDAHKRSLMKRRT